MIDEAQKNISALSGQVVSLQQVLSNKQARGAFGQAQMEEIVRDGLPATLYDFQFTLSNRNRARLRHPHSRQQGAAGDRFQISPGRLSRLLRMAGSEESKKPALAQVRADVAKHVSDIADKYLIPGEVQTPGDHVRAVGIASMPNCMTTFRDVIQKAHRAKVIVVSPNILMLAINTIQTVMKDARMREQADLIRKEVGVLLNDVKRLGERVGKLQRHFNQAEADIKDITVSTDKIVARGEQIEKVELAPPEAPKSIA